VTAAITALQARRSSTASRRRTRRAKPVKVVEFFLEREAAEAMIDEVRDDESTLAEDLRVEALDFR
jgi:hypothetical protein